MSYATASYTFLGEPIMSSDLKTATLQCQFIPPESISGKTCSVQCTFFNWDQFSGPVPGTTSRDAFVLDADWPQLYAGTLNSFDSTVTRTPISGFSNNTHKAMGPIGIFLPHGPHVVKFTVYRFDAFPLSSTTTGNLMFMCLTFSPMTKT